MAIQMSQNPYSTTRLISSINLSSSEPKEKSQDTKTESTSKLCGPCQKRNPPKCIGYCDEAEGLNGGW